MRREVEESERGENEGRDSLLVPSCSCALPRTLHTDDAEHDPPRSSLPAPRLGVLGFLGPHCGASPAPDSQLKDPASQASPRTGAGLAVVSGIPSVPISRI